MVGSTMYSTQLFQDVTSSAKYIDMVTCLMSLVHVRIVPLVDNCPIPALQDEEDLGLVPIYPSSAIAHPSSAVVHLI